jgi:starch synthase
MSATKPTESPGAPLKILMVASECTPFAKTGGLGDAVAGLAKSLHALGHDVRVCVPLYKLIDRSRYAIQFERSCCVHMGNREENWVGVHTAPLDGGVKTWFIEHERFFGRPGVYDDNNREYGDNAFRFGLLSKAAMQVCKDSGWIPDVIHAHDWMTAVVAALLKTWDRVMSPLSETASVLTIHNIGYQGVYHASAMNYLGVGWEHFTANKFEDHGKMNLLKAGIHFADAITTVSPTHAREILTPAGGMGLAPQMNARASDFCGILNGCDYEHWNPAADKFIPARYTPGDLTGKMVCKSALQQRFGLEQNPNAVILGAVSRFAPQKGFGMFCDALPRLMDSTPVQVAVLGSGDGRTEGFFNWLANTRRGRAGVHIGFHNELSHLIFAGADIFVMPSHYEPCGLSQMYALKYGTLPLVRATGGLDDTVQNYDPKTGGGTGFKFWDATTPALYNTIRWAVGAWQDCPPHMAKLQQQAMAQDFSWEKSALKYVEVFRRAMATRRCRNISGT